MIGLPTLAALLLALGVCWVFGGPALRIGGGLAFWVGLIGVLATGNADGALVALIGGLAGLLGQVNHAARHGGAKGLLASELLGGLAGLVRRRDRL